MTLLKTYALDIADRAHKAVELYEKGETEKSLAMLDEVKALHQEMSYRIWREHHISGVVS